MARNPSSLSYKSSLARTKKSSLVGAGTPLLNETDFGNAGSRDSEELFAVGSSDQDEFGIKAAGTTCSNGSPLTRLTFRARRCCTVGPVLRVLLNSFTKSYDTPRDPGSFEGSHCGKSRGVAGGGGSRGPSSLTWLAAGVQLVSDSHISCMSSIYTVCSVAMNFKARTVKVGGKARL